MDRKTKAEEMNPEDDKQQEEDRLRPLTKQEWIGFARISSIGINANLYNGSPGRSPKPTARQACDSTEALFEEWRKRGWV
jgi:hypothetical protein